MSYLKDKLLVDTTPQTFTPDLRGLVAWLETQNPETVYVYSNCAGACLLDQFASNLPRKRWYGLTGYWSELERADPSLRQAISNVAIDRPHTFGAALDRARAALVS